MTATSAGGADEPPPFIKEPRPRRILVIGGGVAGLAALRMLVDDGGVAQQSPVSQNGHNSGKVNEPEAAFERVELIERRADIGGTWYLDNETLKVERTYPGGTADHHWPVHRQEVKAEDERRRAPDSRRPLWPSPAYPALRGNVLPKFLSFSGAEPFPTPASARQQGENGGANGTQNGQVNNDVAATHESHDPFPTLDETEAYLRRIAKPLRPFIRTNVECIGVWELPSIDSRRDKNRWAVQIRDWNQDGRQKTEYWDAIVSASGWTDVPAYPHIKGLERARLQGFVDHCKWYRGPEPYGAEKRVIVVGNGNSGNDAAAQIAACRTLGKHEPVFRAVRHKAPYIFPSLEDPLIRDVPVIDDIVVRKKQKVSGDEVDAIDVRLCDGTKIPDVDKIIVATGYELLNIPHLNLLRRMPTSEADLNALPHNEEVDWNPSSAVKKASERIDLWHNISGSQGMQFDPPGIDGDNPPRIPYLWMLTLHARAATLGFVNLAQSTIPFTTSDIQAHVLRALWDGCAVASALPSNLEGRLEWERKRIKEVRESNLERARRLTEHQDDRGNGAAMSKAHRDQISDPSGILATLPPFTPPERLRSREFHSIGTQVKPFLTELRDVAVRAKPQWQTRLPDFANDKAYFAEHDAMYSQKYASLVARRAAQARTREAIKG